MVLPSRAADWKPALKSSMKTTDNRRLNAPSDAIGSSGVRATTAPVSTSGGALSFHWRLK